MIQELTSNFPQYQNIHRKILLDQQGIIIYTKPIRVYDAKKGIIIDTLHTSTITITRNKAGDIQVIAP